MWIVIFILSIWALWKKKTTKDKNRRIGFLFLLIFFLLMTQNIVKGQNPEYIICGSVTIPKTEGSVYLFLVDSATFKIPMTGRDTNVLEANAKTINFKFNPVKKGKYALRCFQDLNENGKLDKGPWGSREPYGFSGKNKGSFPFNFETISFELTKDTTIVIQLKN